MRKLPVIAAAVLALLPAPALARDLMCQTVRRLEDGRFTYRMEPGLSVSALVARPGPFVHDLGADVVGFTCFRSDPMPELDDVEVLQAGFSLYLGSPGTQARVIALELTDGRIVYRTLNGSLDGGEQRALERIVARMQVRLPPPAAAPAP
jgi:hypothetical protein